MAPYQPDPGDDADSDEPSEADPGESLPSETEPTDPDPSDVEPVDPAPDPDQEEDQEQDPDPDPEIEPEIEFTPQPLPDLGIEIDDDRVVFGLMEALPELDPEGEGVLERALVAGHTYFGRECDVLPSLPVDFETVSFDFSGVLDAGIEEGVLQVADEDLAIGLWAAFSDGSVDAYRAVGETECEDADAVIYYLSWNRETNQVFYLAWLVEDHHSGRH